MSSQEPSPQNTASPEDCRPKITCIGELSAPISNGDSRNDYEIFEGVKERYGVYIFLDESKIPLYVGEAADQPLKDRIIQNYNKTSGGTFRDNYGGETSNGKPNVEENLRLFKEALRSGDLRGANIITISIPKKKRRWIHVLEKALIGFLEPKYNKE